MRRYVGALLHICSQVEFQALTPNEKGLKKPYQKILFVLSYTLHFAVAPNVD